MSEQRSNELVVSRQVRVPAVPVEYENALAQLRACRTLEESRYWADKAEALAAWAKIYHSGEAERESRLLKLHAYRRMGEIALELRPVTYRKGLPKGKQQLPGPRSLLIESGLSKREAMAARRLATINASAFEAMLNMPRPPSPTASMNCNTNSDEGRCMQSLQMLSFWCRKLTPAHMAAYVSRGERQAWRAQLQTIVEWIDEFEQRVNAGPQ